MHKVLTILFLLVLPLFGLMYLDPAGTRSAGGAFPADADGDLIRDDLGLMIRQHFAGNAVAVAASLQLARAWQSAVLHEGGESFSDEVASVRHAVNCALGEATLQKARVHPQDMSRFIERIHATLFDTPPRQALWRQFERRSSVMPHGPTPLNPCRFDVAALGVW